MILILHPNTDKQSDDYRQLLQHLEALPDIQVRVHDEQGVEQTLTELYLVGNTIALSVADMSSLPCVERVVRISEEYRILGRHADEKHPTSFEYNGVKFSQDNLNVFAGFFAVNTP